VPNPDVSSSREVPIASTVVSWGMPRRGNPMRNTGMSMAAPLIPENIATPAIAMQTGSMNQ